MKILVLYYSRHGSVRNMAHKIALGIEKANCEAVLRTVPPLMIQDTHNLADTANKDTHNLAGTANKDTHNLAGTANKDTHNLANAAIKDTHNLADATFKDTQLSPDDFDAYVCADDLRQCQGLALGSPTRFGNMAAPMKHFWDSTSSLWLNGELIDKPSAVFTSSSSMHGGNEATLLTMMIPLLHHGMLIQGIPYSEPSLNATEKGGTPYGASHVAGLSNNTELTDDESNLCIALGYRLAQTTLKLHKR